MTTASSVLFAGFTSFAIVAEATFRTSPLVAMTRVRTVTVTVAPAASFESVHWAGASVQAAVVPTGASASMSSKFNPVGTVSVTWMFDADPGPSFVIVSVKTTSVPVVAVA